MKAKSAHNKGNRFENYLVSVFRESIDVDTHRTYGSGAGLDKNDIRLPNLNIEVEAKNQSQIRLIEDWQQLQRQTMGDNLGVLAIRNPKKPEFEETLLVLSLGDFIDIISKHSSTTKSVSVLDKNLRYNLDRLKQAIGSVMKILE